LKRLPRKSHAERAELAKLLGKPFACFALEGVEGVEDRSKELARSPSTFDAFGYRLTAPSTVFEAFDSFE
jgi:hypothetical protein